MLIKLRVYPLIVLRLWRILSRPEVPASHFPSCKFGCRHPKPPTLPLHIKRPHITHPRQGFSPLQFRTEKLSSVTGAKKKFEKLFLPRGELKHFNSTICRMVFKSFLSPPPRHSHRRRASIFSAVSPPTWDLASTLNFHECPMTFLRLRSRRTFSCCVLPSARRRCLQIICI